MLCCYVVIIISILFIVFVISAIFLFVFFFFKQKTAYEMRISDWSSDVCSSDLRTRARPKRYRPASSRYRQEPPPKDPTRHGEEHPPRAHPIHGSDRKSVV